MKNWQTTAGAIVVIAIAILKVLGVEVPGVSPSGLDLIQAMGAAGGLFRAKDKDVTGAGASAVRVK